MDIGLRNRLPLGIAPRAWSAFPWTRTTPFPSLLFPANFPTDPAAAQNPVQSQTAINGRYGTKANEKTCSFIVQSYDDNVFQKAVEEYYGHSDFANWGYWFKHTRTQKQACEALMEKLLSSIPEKKGLVLDVACGKGATTRYLCRYYRPEAVTAINISKKQLERAQKNAPRCTFLLMDATALKFPNNVFDAVVCVEAAFHFKTRWRFLSEAYRVLRPGGQLVLSDILFFQGIEERAPMLHGENWLANPNTYRQLLIEVGFQDVTVTEATEECWRSFERHHFQYVLEKFRAKQIDPQDFESFLKRRREKAVSVKCYVLAFGKKPRTLVPCQKS